MARGFESKSVTSQQESAFGALDRRSAPADPALEERRRRLELALADVVARQKAARVEAHRLMLQRARAAIEQELASLGPTG